MYVANNVMVEQCTCFFDYLVSLPFLQSPFSARLLALVEAALPAAAEAGFEDDMKPTEAALDLALFRLFQEMAPAPSMLGIGKETQNTKEVRRKPLQVEHLRERHHGSHYHGAHQHIGCQCRHVQHRLSLG